MGTIGVLIVLAIVGGGVWLAVSLILSMVRDSLTPQQRRNQQAAAHQARYTSGSGTAASTSPSTTPADPDDLDGMNEGDYHNGPGGYTTGAYETSFYGTIYERELDHDEED